MTDLLVFVGAHAALSDEIKKLKNEFTNIIVIAPTSQKGQSYICEASLINSVNAVCKELEGHASHTETSRLTVWTYEPSNASDRDSVFKTFGQAAWIEFVPQTLIHKLPQTRSYISTRLRTINSCLHEVSHQVYAKRRKSALPIPQRNFCSSTTRHLRDHWYSGYIPEQVKSFLKKLSTDFRQHHSLSNGSFVDERRLVFSPATDEVCHGQPHPTGSRNGYISGRYRFGVALYPGFHYDVSDEIKHTLECVLFDFDGTTRNVRSENRKYMNIFPNDFLLPRLP